MSVAQAAWRLLTDAQRRYRDDAPVAGWLHDEIDRFEGPLRIAVAGPAQAGKSTLINALVGQRIAPLGDGAPLVWYRDGPAPLVVVHASDGRALEVPARRVDSGLRFDAPPWLPPARDIAEVVVDWPSRVLRNAVLLDTPPADPGGTTMARVRAEADAILYATANGADPDLRALWPERADELADLPPVETILVLSRADEVGGGRIDALTSARQLARRRDRDVAVRGRCQTVVAVSGLIGYAGRRLGDPEYQAVAAIAGRPAPEVAEYLLSADRFTGPRFPVPVPQRTRTELLDLLGLFGVRLATTLVRTGHASADALAEQLLRRSGLTELREAVNELLLDRRELLKARSALLALRTLAQTRPHPEAGRLRADVEQVLASGHELRELGLLAALRAGRTGLPADRAAQARRLIGGYGDDVGTRLDIDDPDDARAWYLAEDALRQWRAESEDPAADQGHRRAAQTLVRTCEGLLADLAGRQAGTSPASGAYPPHHG